MLVPEFGESYMWLMGNYTDFYRMIFTRFFRDGVTALADTALADAASGAAAGVASA